MAIKIVTDTAANLTPEQSAELGVAVIPFRLTFNGKTYQDGADIPLEEVYRLYLEYPDEFPFTSQPSVGEFAAIYHRFPDDEIISIHLSSGLSGTYSSAQTAADLVAGERITVVDSRTVGPALGWLVEIAALGARRGWPRERILKAIRQVRQATLTTATFNDIRYLVHSGRISHLRGLIASVLKIKPVLGIDDVDGKLIALGQEISTGRAIQKKVELTRAQFGEQKIRLQLLHGQNLRGVEKLREAITAALDCVEDTLVTVTTVLGAHAGPTVFGLAAIAKNDFDRLLE